MTDTKNARFSVMTMNLRFGLANDGLNSWEYRKDLCADIFRSFLPTFLCVQEANHFQTQFLRHELKDYDFIGWHNPSIKGWQNNLIFFHKTWECLKSQHYFLSETPGIESIMQDSKWPRQCVIGVFQNSSNRIVIANTHFDFEDIVQQRSSELVIQFLMSFPQDCPVIITGDFNSNPGSKSYNIFKKHGFCEIFDNQHSTTFHKFTGEHTGMHIDWILYRGNLKISQQMIITDSTKGKFPSDHYPVMALFDNI